MYRRCTPLFAVFVVLGVWTALDCESQATPLEVAATLGTPTPAAQAFDKDEQALLEFLQTDGLAALICYAGYVIVPPPTGVNDPPVDNGGGGTPKDNGGDPPGPPDETPDPPDEPPPPEDSPEPASIVLGLVGLGVTSLTYVKRRRSRTSNPS